MGSSIKINNRVDMSGKKVSFNTKETENKTPNKRVGNRKFNMEKMAKNALGSIPSRVLVNGNLEQRVEMDFLKMGQGSIPTVAGNLTKTELNKSGEKAMGIKDINYVLYHDTTGVRTVAKAAVRNGNSLSSDIKKAESNGWVKTEMGWMYKENGKLVTGWKQIDGKWYYFESTGVMQTGWKQVSGKWYYLHTDGAMRTDWKQIGGKWYYFHTDGAMRTDWKQIDGKWYYFHTDGAMRTGWKQIGDKWYYFHEDGHMAKSEKIQGEDGRVYVIDENGVYTAGNIDKLIDIAMSQRYEITGFKENKKIYINENGEYVESDEGDNDTIYGKWYGMNKEPWCGMFVSWCAAQSGMLNSNKSGTLDEGKIPKFSYCLTGKNIYKKADRYYPVSSNYEPKRGDLFFHLKKIIEDGKEKWVGHTGIIIAYDKRTDIIYSIEGNTDDSVLIRKTNRLNNDGSSYFDGFGSNGGSSFGDIPEGALSRGGRTN
ncbi:CHAP domain-containing protein [Lachnoanaerobaculum sp. Marseille-Q4761]|uniref:CHAP domain-containing protein n=1 Tax=Lachnoanaerobaculum sp. Marseille-Q4761 TaxID=2819511 RepID=UPI001AA170D5|nr:CHAP domain-containing protein [Lachnoanaerobaculum sp. Marseille-Q4761]MBO1869851.1 CHAP domain-containing protein [Lachnoanaerobaculum sp. Marseille-Q4761]